jgi:LacI family transcriptional regulator
VSRVLNRYPHVRAEVRESVLRAVQALGYRPDRVAQGLARRQTRTVGLLVADITNPVYGEAARVVTEVLGAHGYNLMLADSQYLPSLQRQHVGLLREHRVDGIIFGSVLLDDPEAEDLVASGYPCIMFNRRLRSGRGSYVVLDNADAGYQVTRHVLALGHRRLGFVAGPANTSTAAERLDGFRRALAEAGLPADPRLVREGHYKADFARQAGLELLGLPRPPTAIVAGNDLMALAVLQAAGEREVRVPQDLTVVGIDNIPMAAHHRIRLTTVDGHAAEVARMAATWMLEILSDPGRYAARPFRHVVPPTLIVRATSAPPAAARAGGRRARA